MKNISIASVANDAERVMQSLLNSAISDAERERNKHPQNVDPKQLNADTQGSQTGRKALTEEEQAAEAEAAAAREKVAPTAAPQASISVPGMMQEITDINAQLLSMGPQRVLDLMTTLAAGQEIG